MSQSAAWTACPSSHVARIRRSGIAARRNRKRVALDQDEVGPQPGREPADLGLGEPGVCRARREALQRLGRGQPLIGKPAARRLAVEVLTRDRCIDAEPRIIGLDGKSEPKASFAPLSRKRRHA